MSTNREVISRVRSTHRLLSADSRITDRAILAELKGISKLIIKRETDRRKLWNTSTIFTPIPCLEMETVSLSDCCDFHGDGDIARSKHQLPKILDGNYGLMIQGVFSVKGDRKIKEITKSSYINYKQLNLPENEVFFWIEDSYLFVTNPMVKLVSITAYFESDVPDKILYPDCECSKKLTKNPCKNPLDSEFKSPGSIEDQIIDLVSKRLLSSYFKIPEDHTSDNKDDQVNKQ